MLILSIISLISGCIQQQESNGNNNNHNTTILYVGIADSKYRTIQEAVDAAVDGTTIIIQNGSYNELITINKSICLRGEDRNTTLINFNPDSEITQVPIITINADNCSIENVQITLSKPSAIVQGISITSNNNIIKNTIITGVTTGIQLIGLSSNSNSIIHNKISNNLIGMDVINSKDNTISNNIFSNTQYNIYLSTNSDNNDVSFNTMNNSSYGIRIKGSEKNTVYKNCIKNNDIGVYCCCGAESNHIYNNCLINNNNNARENSGLVNVWYDDLTLHGNYWDDYNGYDMNQDGIGDTGYAIASAEDYDMNPLMIPPLDVPCDK